MNEMRLLYLAWQDPESRSWFPVGQLTFDGDVYRFVYTKGAKEATNFVPFLRMTELDVVYESKDLFPFFANRLLSENRPEYNNFLNWLNVQESKANPIVLLGRSEGLRETDSLTVFPCPQKDAQGRMEIHFFCHGIRHLGDHVIQLVNNLKARDQLYLVPDPQNLYDRCAIALRTSEPPTIVGYCPRFLAKDFVYILNDLDPDNILVTVE